VNSGQPGTVHLAVISGKVMNGSGVIATITFDRAGDSTGAINVKGSVINLAGKTLPVTFNGSPGADSADSRAAVTSPITSDGTATNTTTSTTTSATSGLTGAPFVVGGTLTMPTDGSVARERKEAPAQPAQQESRENPVPVAAPAEAPDAPETQTPANEAQGASIKVVPSVLDKFRLFAGEKTVKNLVALFERDMDAPFSQIPAICIADGKASVKVTITKVFGDKAPNFAFSSARYLSLSQPGDGEWQVEVKPDPGVVKASISMLTGETMQEIPLTVSPMADVDLDKSGKVTEADFQLFLKTRGTDVAPKFDLNGDGKRDYLDDYIFTANYLEAVQGSKIKVKP